MQSKFSGSCRGCSKSYPEGTDIYWSKEDGGWHWHCFENRPPGPEAFALADRLHFIRPGDPIPVLWMGEKVPVRESEAVSLFEN